jgi:hypothetical protein
MLVTVDGMVMLLSEVAL